MNKDTFDRGVCPGGQEGLADLCQSAGSVWNCLDPALDSNGGVTQPSMNLYVTVTDDRLN